MQQLPLYSEHFKAILKSFEQAMRAKNYQKPHHCGYITKEFLCFLENIGIGHVTEVKAKDVIAYYEYLMERPRTKRSPGALSEGSIRHYLLFVRLLFDHLIDTGILSASPVHLPRFIGAVHSERSVLSIEEIELLYAACQTRLDRAILALAYGCGLRRTEIVKLDIADVQFLAGTLTVREGKLGKTRRVPLSASVITDLREYIINERSSSACPSFLLGSTGQRIRGNWMNDRVKMLVKKTGNQVLIKKEISLHCLRHSIATHFLDKGAQMEFVRRFLGHVNLDTTHTYSKRRKQRKLLSEHIR
jgi:integrase/recombinase XerD